MIGGLLGSKQCCFSGLVVSLSEVNWSRKMKTNMNKVVRMVDEFSLGKPYVFGPHEVSSHAVVFLSTAAP